MPPRDRLDIAVLDALQQDGRATMAEIGDRIGLSASAVTRRLERLEAEGVVRGYLALLDPKAIGLTVTAFVTVTLARQSEDVIEAFESTVVQCPEVAEVHLMAGSTDYLLRVVVQDLEHYEAFLKRRLTRIRGVAHVQSAFSLSSLKVNPMLSLSHLAAAERPGPRPRRPQSERERTAPQPGPEGARRRVRTGLR